VTFYFTWNVFSKGRRFAGFFKSFIDVDYCRIDLEIYLNSFYTFDIHSVFDSTDSDVRNYFKRHAWFFSGVVKRCGSALTWRHTDLEGMFSVDYRIV
jgi:hypothetical protein